MKMGKKITTTIIIFLVVCMLSVSVFADGDILKRGSKGSEVKELQELLMEHGVFDYSKATGYFGKITEDSVKKFQRNYDLKADGIVGEQTWTMLRTATVVKDAVQNADDGAKKLSTTLLGTISKGME
ncbi:MAG: peptidoglycan-binding protein, partial [Clostridiales bacterium]|nr:peptidoglycan-binding protein [Clostridiales bacterium]